MITGASILTEINTIDGPHKGQPVVIAGPALSDADAVIILLHGRGAGAQNILGMANNFYRDNIAYVAPQAAMSTWYPYSFMAGDRNEPFLSSALAFVGAVVDEVKAAGFTQDQIMLTGWSQGSCLAAEYVARTGGRFGGVGILAGGLIGEEGTTWDASVSLDGTPIFMGCADNDSHIPLSRFEESVAHFKAAGAVVDARVYPGIDHSLIQDELDAVDALVDQLLGD